MKRPTGLTTERLVDPVGIAVALAGLRPLAPGWHRFEVRPAANCGLSRIHAAVESPYGRITIDWTAEYWLSSVAPSSHSFQKK